MQTEDALERTAYEVAEDAWRENVRYIESLLAAAPHREGLRPARWSRPCCESTDGKREFGIRYG